MPPKSVFSLELQSGASPPTLSGENSPSIQVFYPVPSSSSLPGRCQITYPFLPWKTFVVKYFARSRKLIGIVRVAIYSAGAGGNYILDATNFLEFLPTSHAWLVTFMSIWWAVGYTVTGLLAWAFMSDFSCATDATPATCTRADNMGWRYLHFTCGALVLLMAIARLTLIRMVQTPRWLISQNRDEEVIKVLNDMSTQYHRSYSLTLEQL